MEASSPRVPGGQRRCPIIRQCVCTSSAADRRTLRSSLTSSRSPSPGERRGPCAVCSSSPLQLRRRSAQSRRSHIRCCMPCSSVVDLSYMDDPRSPSRRRWRARSFIGSGAEADAQLAGPRCSPGPMAVPPALPHLPPAVYARAVPLLSNVMARCRATARSSSAISTGPPMLAALRPAWAASSTTPPTKMASSAVRWNTRTP